jgi:DNA-binding NarL/FixJ family response regulator
MNQQPLNVFIADEDQIMTTALKNDLKQQFGSNIEITVFNDGKQCLENMHENVHMVILVYDFKKKSAPVNGIDLLKFIKKKYPMTEVVMHSSNDDIRIILKSIKKGASSYVVKESNSFSHIRSIINRRFTEPIRRIIREFGVRKFVVIFLGVFLLMGIVVWIALKNH